MSAVLRELSTMARSSWYLRWAASRLICLSALSSSVTSFRELMVLTSSLAVCKSRTASIYAVARLIKSVWTAPADAGILGSGGEMKGGLSLGSGFVSTGGGVTFFG